MKFYTVQSQAILGVISKNKALVSDKKFEMFPKQYQWMKQQLKKRLPHLVNPSQSLIWLWDTKPDISEPGYGEKGEKLVVQYNERTEKTRDYQTLLFRSCWVWRM